MSHARRAAGLYGPTDPKREWSPFKKLSSAGGGI